MDKHMMAWKEQVKLVRHTDDVNYKVQNVMIPALTDAELDEYVRARSGEVVTYKLSGGAKMTIEDIRKLNREYKNDKIQEKSINIEKQGKLLRGTLQDLTALIEKGGFKDGTIRKDIQE